MRPLVRPNSEVNVIRKMLPEVINTSSFRSLAHVANGKLSWPILINNIGHDDPQPCDCDPEWDGEISKF